tara:strand:+ start:1274 stop:1546 length:273 start_codon:yes stop_codon:yes gene_type:complete
MPKIKGEHMKTRTIESIQLEINVLTDFQDDVRQNLQSLDNQTFHINSSWNLRGHLHKAVGSLALLHDALDMEIRTCKIDLDVELMSQRKH